ncbi:MAG: penicillin-binding protein activator [Gammaproteobacteria bacterium]|nr:penicillin-binding protein activator [Gammaproteobacteria bacterium]
MAPRSDSEPAQVALQLALDGDFKRAGEEYLRIASLAKPLAARRYRAQAVEAFLDGGDLEQARQWSYAAPATDPVDAGITALESLNRSRLALRDSAFDVATAQLAQLRGDDLSPYSRARANESQAQLAEQRGEPMLAATLRIELDPALGAASLRAANQRALWRTLSALPPAELRRAAVGDRSGWLELALLAREKRHDSARFDSALGGWQERHRDHPANASLLAELRALSRQLSRPPTRIALLLPLQGPLAAAATVVRDGLLAAWYADATNPERPSIRIYETSADNVVQRYQQALTDGAELIIGPLAKDELERLARQPTLPVITLALNTLEAGDGITTLPDRLVQFGLPPDHEAREIARRARAEGHLLGVVITPDSDWGKRLSSAFQDEWLALGGRIVQVVTFRGNYEQYADAVEEALDIATSRQRHRLIQQLVGARVGFTVRPRQDVDFVFLAASPEDARQILPQLRFLGADALPVYATHHVYTGVVDAAKDQDLNGLTFGDMPGVLGLRDTTVWRTLRDSWSARVAESARLFAFGMDAYLLVPQLGQLLAQPDRELAGHTGELHIAQGVVMRRLTFARFSNGTPVLQQPPAARGSGPPAP